MLRQIVATPVNELKAAVLSGGQSEGAGGVGGRGGGRTCQSRLVRGGNRRLLRELGPKGGCRMWGLLWTSCSRDLVR